MAEQRDDVVPASHSTDMDTSPLSLEQFRAKMLGAGYDEVIERTWPPLERLDLHTHPFEAAALVVRGEMWLQVDGKPEVRLVPGDRFHLAHSELHTERYGAEGATYWVARRN